MAEHGQDLYDGDINLNAGDKLNFRLMNIRSGPPTGSITPYCALYNVDTGKFEMTWGLQLSTASGDTLTESSHMSNTQLPTSLLVLSVVWIYNSIHPTLLPSMPSLMVN